MATIAAIYEHGVFRPIDPVNLPEGTKVLVEASDEAINVRATIQSDPLVGVGFGRPFLQVVTVPSIAFFEFWNYESHHNILWVWMKTGAIGFICFFLIITKGIARSVVIMKKVKDPELRSLAVVAMSAIIMSALNITADRIALCAEWRCMTLTTFSAG